MTNLLPPMNTSLPFMVYDIFNPAKSNVSRINKINTIIDTEEMIEKIVPIKINNKRHAYLVYFNDENSDDAYDLLSKSQNEDYCEWNESEVNGMRFNIILKKNDKDRDKFLDIPNYEDRKLPFFAYGVFKEGQLAYSRIKECVRKVEKKHRAQYKMGIRDGIPTLFFDETDDFTLGDLIYFNEEDREEAYETISSTQSKKLYVWKKIKVNGTYANALVANHPEKGTSDLIKGNSYDGFDDYFFSDVINLIENSLNYYEDKTIENFFHLQMNYLLLWVAIERFCILKYGLNEPYINRENFAEQNKFQECLKNIERDNKSIFSAKDFNIHYLNKKEPYESIEYYYTIRCNVAHRGKSPEFVDFDSHKLIYDSLEELLNIFKEVLIDSFDRDIFQKRGGILKRL